MIQGWQQRYAFDLDGQKYYLDNLTSGLSWREDPVLLGTRVGLRRQPISIQRFGEGGTASLRAFWGSLMDQSIWSLFGATLGYSLSDFSDIKVDAYPTPNPVNLYNILPYGLMYSLEGCVANDIRIGIPAEGAASLDISYIVANIKKEDTALTSVIPPVNTTPLVGCNASALLNNATVDLFDIQIRFARTLNLAGINNGGIATRYESGQWTAEIQLGTYFDDDTLYSLARSGSAVPFSVDFGSGAGSVRMTCPSVIVRPSSPDIQRNQDGVLRVFLQPLLDTVNSPIFTVL